jgi:hypothetical protein
VLLGPVYRTGVPVYYGGATTGCGPQAPLRILNAQIDLEVGQTQETTKDATVRTEGSLSR